LGGMGLVKKDKSAKSISVNEIDETAIIRKEEVVPEEAPQEISSNFDALVVKKADNTTKIQNNSHNDFRKNGNNEKRNTR